MRINEHYLAKLRYILPAYTLVAWGSVLVVGLVRWYLFMGKYPLLELAEETWYIWVAGVFPGIPVYFLLKPRFDKLVFTKNNTNGSWQMQGIAWLSIFVMLISSQLYLSTETGKLIEVKNVREIAKHQPVRYYRLKEYAVHRPIGGLYHRSKVTGRHNENLEIDIYFVHPILTHKTQAITFTPLYWYGVTFHKRISNWNSNRKKQERFVQFLNESVQKMNKYDFYAVDHFERKPESYDRQSFRKAVSYALRKPVNNDFVILQPKTKAYSERSSNTVGVTWGGFGFGMILFMLALIRPQMPGRDEVYPDSPPLATHSSNSSPDSSVPL